MTLERKQMLLKTALILGSFGFFGPVMRDSGVSHLQNPTWPGHSKVHMMWFIAYLFFTGIIQLYLILFRKREDYGLVLGWQLCNLLAFWSAAALAPLYGGAVIDSVYHTQILGYNENILFFGLLTLLWSVSLALLLNINRLKQKHG